MERETDRVLFYHVSEEDGEQRVDTFLASRQQDLTRSRIQELIKEGYLEVNGLASKPSHRLKPGDHVRLAVPPVQPYPLEPEPVAFTPIHEDESIIVLNKPPGVVIHPAPGHSRGTLVHGLLHHCADLSGIGGALRPGIVHRLDKDTSGLMVVAKNDRAHACLSEQFKTGKVKKRYVAVVHGILKGDSGKIDLPISRHPRRRKEMSVATSGGKRALTRWRKQEELASRFTLISVAPKTGRTHQIRVHLAHWGHPILGDGVYGQGRNWWKRHVLAGNPALPAVERQMLHAECLGFIHPASGLYCEFRIPPPEDMTSLLEALRRISSPRGEGKELDFIKDKLILDH